MQDKCFFCDGSGYFENTLLEKSEICPVCKPTERELAARRNALIDDRLHGVPFVAAKHIGPLFQNPPTLLVIHSGQSGPGIAEYFINPVEKLPDGSFQERIVSAHLAYSATRNEFVQCVPLNRVAWHVGGSRYLGNRRLNFCSIGVELPGPYDAHRGIIELGKFRYLVESLLRRMPTLKTAVRHCDIDAKKKDPGDGFEWSWLSGFGLDLPFSLAGKYQP